MGLQAVTCHPLVYLEKTRIRKQPGAGRRKVFESRWSRVPVLVPPRDLGALCTSYCVHQALPSVTSFPPYGSSAKCTLDPHLPKRATTGKDLLREGVLGMGVQRP